MSKKCKHRLSTVRSKELLALAELRSTGGLNLVVGDEGEGILCCRIRVDVHPKSYRDIVYHTLQRAAVITAREEEDEEKAAVQGKGAREGAESGAEAGVRLGQSVFSTPPPKGDGGGPLILTRSATLSTHVISAVWRKCRSSDVEVNAKDRARAEAGDDNDSLLSSFPPLPRYRGLLVSRIGVRAL